MISSSMWKQKAIAVLAVAVMISVSINAGLFLSSHPTPSQLPQSYTVLDVTAYDAQGNVVARRHVVGDPMLQGFAIPLWGGIFDPSPAYSYYGTAPYNLTKMDGTAFNPMYGGFIGFGNFPSDIYYQHVAIWGFIAVGNDSTAVAPQNYQLGHAAGTAQLGIAPLASMSTSISGNQMNLTVSSSIILASGGNVTETGLVSQTFSSTTWTATNAFLCTRDVFSVITIPIGGAIAIQITLVVNA